MAEQHLTKSELAIMEVMWEQEEALTASEIIKASGDKEWNCCANFMPKPSRTSARIFP